MEISVFKTLTDSTNPTHTTVKAVLNQIRTGGKLKDRLIEISTLEGEEYKKAKRSLPVVCFCGKFSRRNKESIIAGSSLLILDFDEGTEDELNTLRAEVNNADYTYSTFSSPRRRGRFKALIRIPVINTDDEFKQYFAALRRKYKTVDPSGKDISRCSFFSYDEGIYINKNASVWSDKFLTKKEKISNTSYEVKDWGVINRALRKIEDSSEGELHLVRTKISFLFGGWIASKHINYETAYSLLNTAVSKNTSNLPSAMKDIEDGLKAGMDKPCTMFQQNEVLDMKVGIDKMYKTMRDSWEEVLHFREHGYQRGVDIGWKVAEEYMTILKGTTSIGFGAPYSGKTQFFFNVMINIARTQDWRFVIFTPETGSVSQIYGELISISAGQSFIGDFKMTEDRFKEHSNFIAKHFLVIDNEGKNMEVEDFYNQIEAIEREYDIHVDCTLIDPANFLDLNVNAQGGREDKAWGKVYDAMLTDARMNKRHNAIITHTRDQQIQKRGEQMYYPPAHPREMAAGQISFRKGMLIWSAYRPLDINNNPLTDEDGNLYEENETHIIISKAKPKGTAKIGRFKLYYDFQRNQYYEEFLGGKKYPNEHEEQGVVIANNAQNVIEPNIEFDEEVPF